MNNIGGKYEGNSFAGRIVGTGTYKFKDYEYSGGFYDGLFHGEGTLTVPGGRFEGVFENGILIEGGFIYSDGLRHRAVENEFWDYCSMYDPRFNSEIESGLENGDSLKQVSPNPNPPKLPANCYDTIDGYYDPKRGKIIGYVTEEPIKTPDEDEIKWILTNCRVGKA